MLSSRPLVRRLAAFGARPAPRTYPQRLLQRSSRRGYSSHGDQKPGSDVPWMIGAVAIAVPGIWWGLQPSKHAAHGEDHGHGHDDHHAAEDKHEEKPAEEEAADAAADKGAEGGAESGEQAEDKTDEQPAEGAEEPSKEAGSESKTEDK